MTTDQLIAKLLLLGFVRSELWDYDYGLFQDGVEVGWVVFEDDGTATVHEDVLNKTLARDVTPEEAYPCVLQIVEKYS